MDFDCIAKWARALFLDRAVMIEIEGGNDAIVVEQQRMGSLQEKRSGWVLRSITMLEGNSSCSSVKTIMQFR